MHNLRIRKGQRVDPGWWEWGEQIPLKNATLRASSYNTKGKQNIPNRAHIILFCNRF